jgi:hypothetical protein
MVGTRVVRRGRLFSLFGALLTLLVATAPASAVAGWSNPARLGSISGCSDVSAAIDADGRQHLVAECGTHVRYLTNVTGSWTTTTFSHPADRFDLEPQIAIDGTTVYVAYTRAAPATCGLDHIGVYYRWRTLPSGAWSTTTRLGRSGDVLQSFRVVDDVFHATVMDATGAVQYETTVSGSLKRYRLPGATGTSSMRVGSDGAARIVYETDSLLRYAVFHGSGFDWSAIPATGPGDSRPLLVLDADNRAHVIWTHTGEEGCGAEDPGPLAGTYYATNRTGEWTAPAARRFTRNIGDASLTMDAVSGQVHVLIALETGVKYYTKTAAGRWSGVTVSSHGATSATIRSDGEGRRLLAAYTRLEPDFALGGIYALTKP